MGGGGERLGGAAITQEERGTGRDSCEAAVKAGGRLVRSYSDAHVQPRPRTLIYARRFAADAAASPRALTDARTTPLAPSRTTPRAQRIALALLVALAAVYTTAMAGGAAASAQAAEVSCPNANPIVNENNCMGEGTEANRLSDYSETIGGFTTQTSYNRGENVQLKIGTSASSFPATSVNINVYRIGWYGGKGARLIPAAGATKVKVNNSLTCNPMNKETGELSCSNWDVTYTIPGSALPVSGIYEATFTDLADGGIQNMVTFTVREERASEVLFVLPISTL